MSKLVVIIGASVAGVGAATELRRCGFDGRILLLDSQPDLPYDRPPLSKSILVGEKTPDDIRLLPSEDYEKLEIELGLGEQVMALDADARRVTLRSGVVLEADWIVIATGARARPFPAATGCEGIVTIRDLKDGIALREKMLGAKSMAVIGGGFVGAEVASSARSLGLATTVIELEELPFIRILGREIAERLAQIHTAAGVDLRTGLRVERVVRLPDLTFQLQLSDGSKCHADIVVAGLGAVPNLEFLAGSGLEIQNGILCDEFGRTSRPGVYATGDVASWAPRADEARHRDEHWTCAREHARIVAHDICGIQGPEWKDYLPYFWSDMHKKRVQMLGTTQPTDQVRFVYEDRAKDAFLAEFGRNGVLVGVVGCNAAVRLMKYRASLPLKPRFESSEAAASGAKA